MDEDDFIDMNAQQSEEEDCPYGAMEIQTGEDPCVDDYGGLETDKDEILEKIMDGTATREEFDSYVSWAVKSLSGCEMTEDLEERAARVESGRRRMQEDIDRLNMELPSCGIKTVEDIQDDTAVISLLQRGLSVADAYYLAHRREVELMQQAAARQAAVNQAGGKQHLKTTSGRASCDISVPEDVREQYRAFFPDWTEKQIAENYKKQRR